MVAIRREPNKFILIAKTIDQIFRYRTRIIVCIDNQKSLWKNRRHIYIIQRHAKFNGNTIKHSTIHSNFRSKQKFNLFIVAIKKNFSLIIKFQPKIRTNCKIDFSIKQNYLWRLIQKWNQKWTKYWKIFFVYSNGRLVLIRTIIGTCKWYTKKPQEKYTE